ncbi:hypothetical protein [Paraburkholderia sp.]|uniref:hypothetical protein n=1 Tax=Paraburkholderia sp. TaxID=1926495 RepID=UPI0023862E4E|nr:hypothetical protein [Paraburkholderia sp.]MDE1180086.1 hypothetical protein [Paraburkholderia sp.]
MPSTLARIGKVKAMIRTARRIDKLNAGLTDTTTATSLNHEVVAAGGTLIALDQEVPAA